MKELSGIFQTVVGMSLTATYVMLVILILRQILKNAANWTPYGMWLVVFLRLVLPASFSSALSLLPLFTRWNLPAAIARPFQPDVIRMSDTWTGQLQANSIPPAGQWTGPLQQANSILPAAQWPSATAAGSAAGSATVSPASLAALPQSVLTLTPTEILALLWLAGLIVMLFHMLRTYWQMKRRLAEATLIHDNIYETDAVAAPFVFGLLRPRIILPLALAPEFRAPVLDHERIHIARKDYLIKPLVWLVLALHWFNPFIWLAFHLLNMDLEMSCDARALRQAGRDQRAAYGSALLHVSRQRVGLALNPLAFGESSIKARVRQILNGRKPAFWVTVAAVVLIIAVGVSLLADPPKTGASAEGTTQTNPSASTAMSTVPAASTGTAAATVATTAAALTTPSYPSASTTASSNPAATAPTTSSSRSELRIKSASIEIWTSGSLARNEAITDENRLRVIQNAVTAYFLDSSGAIAKKPEQMANHIRLQLVASDNGTNTNSDIPLAKEPYYVFFSDGKYHIQYGLAGMDKRVHTAYYEPFVALLFGEFGFHHEPEHRLQPGTDGVDAFLKLAKDIGFTKLPKAYENDVCFNITPPEIQILGCEIFKYKMTSEAFLKIGNEIHPLGTGFGGSGVADVQICDFDRDRQPELIYTFSWGSGIHRSQIGVFNLKTRQETLLKGAFMNGDMYLGKVAGDQFTAYSAKVDIKDGNFADLVLTRIEPVAQIFAKDGTATVVYFTNSFFSS